MNNIIAKLAIERTTNDIIWDDLYAKHDWITIVDKNLLRTISKL